MTIHCLRSKARSETFFGLGLGEYFLYESGPLSVGSQKALNSYFPMPFRKSAKITITNEGSMATAAFYYNIDWQKHSTLPDDSLYFYAEYRQAQPNAGLTNDWKLNGDPSVYNVKNTDGKSNYVVMDTQGAGHYVGMTLSVLQNQGDWWGEGDDMMFIDDKLKPHHHRYWGGGLFSRRVVLRQLRDQSLRLVAPDFFISTLRQPSEWRRRPRCEVDGVSLPHRLSRALHEVVPDDAGTWSCESSFG